MNKKFKYKKSLLAAILSATLLAGCDGGGSGSSSDTPPVDSGTGSLPEVKPDPTPNPEPTPEPTPDPEPTPEPTPDPEPTPEPEPEPVPTKTGYLTLGGSLRVTGDITCNDESSDGFTFTPGDKVTCVAGNNTTIATFDTQSEAARSLRAVEKVSFSLEDAQELAGSDNKKSNALSLVTSMNSCPANSPFLGWLGVFLTGSDTSSNALFGSLQSTTAQQINVSDTLLVAANTSGGVTGKMISPQSIAVACAATGMVGRESELFRYTVKHSLIFASVIGVITLLQAYVFTGMLVS